jgi:hypothetical protein
MLRRIILSTLIFIPLICGGQIKMLRDIKKSPGGLWYAQYSPRVENPAFKAVVVCIGGSGEYGSYTASNMYAEVIRIVERNGYPKLIASGTELPFTVIAPLATLGKDIADHRLIAAEIGNVVKSIPHDYAIMIGLSQGGQTVSGFYFQCRTTTEINNGWPSSFKNADMFDGFGVFCGQIPGSNYPCSNPNKSLIVVHAIGDTRVNVNQGVRIMSTANSCRSDKVKANYTYTYGLKKVVDGTTVKYNDWVSTPIPDSVHNRLVIIPGGGHSTSWEQGYNWNATSGAGKEVREWILRICKPVIPPPIKCEALLDTINNTAIFILPDSTIFKTTIIKN